MAEGMGLGRGLGALLGGESVAEVGRRRVREVPPDRIEPNPRQPRRQMDAGALEDLAESIRANGVLQPLLVRVKPGTNPAEERFELVAGERRLRASRLAGLERVPVLVHDLDDGRSLEVAILENVQREDLNPIDTARGYQRLVDEFGYSHARIAERVGRSRMGVSNTLRLLKLPEEILDMVATGKLSEGHARALLGLEDAAAVTSVASAVAEAGLSVRETERRVRDFIPESTLPEESEPTQPIVEEKKKNNSKRRDPAIASLEKKLASELRTKVTITQLRGRGKIILEFASLQDLKDLVHRLVQSDVPGEEKNSPG
ncbi:MAG: ParB/RepB/Spo0J family partition protein [Magnetococcus sp. DMHC-1]|nr:ParB/RepB/Spo0J family partition protein [Magnetococcales bacterium]MBF0154838.1 ParB/RepB/Spo0J family partition protein [Magnetococcales bacterium]